MRYALAASIALLALGFGPQSEPKKPSASNSIDSAVSKKAAPGDDGEFLRRLMIDLLGYPPTAEQAKAFFADASPNKRVAKIEELLATDDFADLWSRQFAEVFFGDTHNVTMDTNPKLSKEAGARIVKDFIGWFKMKLQKDKPWTEIVSDILDARGSDVGDPALAYKLAMFNEEGAVSEFATRVGRQFLGIRLLCAKCHDHPFDQWTVEHFYGLAAFNARVKTMPPGKNAGTVQVVYEDKGEVQIDPVKIDSDVVQKSKAAGVAKPIFLFGGMAPPGDGVDRMKALIPLMTGKANKQLPKMLVNRVWSWLMGRGIVNPVDDFNFRTVKSPLSGLLDTLTADAQQNGTSIKHVVRVICNSQAYQLSCAAEGVPGKADFSRATVKQLSGEQLLNSVGVATRSKPDRDAARVIQMVASLFPAGAVWCETTPLPGNARQALLLRNNTEIMAQISSGGVLSKIKGAPGTVEEKVDEMFLAALTRKATDAEKKRYVTFIEAHAGSGWEDAYWTILNTAEFVTRH